MTKPVLSIIIPAYNCGSSILGMTNIILEQPFQDLELIIVNDQSTDNTAEVLENIAASDRRVSIITNDRNSGAAASRNNGIDQARGQYLMFLDADDTIEPTAITKLTTAISQPGCQLAVGGFHHQLARNGQLISSVTVCTNQPELRRNDESFRLYILRLLGNDGRLYQVWNKIYQANIISNNNLRFRPGVDFGEDFVFNLDYLSHINDGVSFVLEPIYNYRQDLTAGTFAKSSLVLQNRLDNYADLGKFLADEPSSPQKTALLDWVLYKWLYSHILAIIDSDLPKSTKRAKISEIHRTIKLPAIGPAVIIGAKRRQLEKIIRQLVSKPRSTLLLFRAYRLLRHSRAGKIIIKQIKS